MSEFLPHFPGLKVVGKVAIPASRGESDRSPGRCFVSGLMEREQYYPRPVGTSSGYKDQCDLPQNNKGPSRLPILKGTGHSTDVIQPDLQNIHIYEAENFVRIFSKRTF